VAELSGGKVPSKTELEAAEASHQRAVANVDSAKAAVVQAKATLKSDETNIAKAVIRAPINGVVLTRKVEPGQTVVAQMTTPVLFTMAEDLTKMELQVKVDEADVGSVEARPAGKLHRLGLAGTQLPGNHPARRHRLDDDRQRRDLQDRARRRQRRSRVAPGHDGDRAHHHSQSRKRAAGAERRAALFAADDHRGHAAGQLRLAPDAASRRSRRSRRQEGGGAEPQVWVLRQRQPQAITVQVGASNGRQTEITGGELKAGMAVITDYQEAKK
jgi:HlyD family secretion protein